MPVGLMGTTWDLRKAEEERKKEKKKTSISSAGIFGDISFVKNV